MNLNKVLLNSSDPIVMLDKDKSACILELKIINDMCYTEQSYF